MNTRSDDPEPLAHEPPQETPARPGGAPAEGLEDAEGLALLVGGQQHGSRLWYTATAFLFFLFGGVLALLMRIQLAVPGNTFSLPTSTTRSSRCTAR